MYHEAFVFKIDVHILPSVFNFEASLCRDRIHEYSLSSSNEMQILLLKTVVDGMKHTLWERRLTSTQPPEV